MPGCGAISKFTLALIFGVLKIAVPTGMFHVHSFCAS